MSISTARRGPMEVDSIPFDDRSAFMIFERDEPLVDQQGNVIYLATLPAEIWMMLSQTELPPGANPEPYPATTRPRRATVVCGRGPGGLAGSAGGGSMTALTPRSSRARCGWYLPVIGGRAS